MKRRSIHFSVKLSFLLSSRAEGSTVLKMLILYQRMKAKKKRKEHSASGLMTTSTQHLQMMLKVASKQQMSSASIMTLRSREMLIHIR